MKRLAFKKKATPQIEFDLDACMIIRSVTIFVQSSSIDALGVKDILQNDLKLDSVGVLDRDEEEGCCTLIVKLEEEKLSPTWFFTYAKKDPIKVFQGIPKMYDILKKLNALPSSFSLTFLISENER